MSFLLKMATTTQQLPRSFSLENIRNIAIFDWLRKSARVYHKAQERRGMVEQEPGRLSQQALHLPGGVGQRSCVGCAACVAQEALIECQVIALCAPWTF